ncbi:MAG: polyketide synthase [bacterium]
MSPAPVTLAVEDGVARVAMRDRAGDNMLGVAFVDALVAALHGAAADPTARVVLLEGLPEVFCAGAPPALLDDLRAGRAAPADLTLPRVFFDLPLPIIAAMAGHAVGGGLCLGLCADIVLLARESRYGANFMALGFTPGMGATAILEHALSPAIAHELLYTAELRRGDAFAGATGINHVLPRGEVVDRALDIALRIAEKPRDCVELLKRTLSLPRRRRYEAALTLETLMHTITFRRSPGAGGGPRDVG